MSCCDKNAIDEAICFFFFELCKKKITKLRLFSSNCLNRSLKENKTRSGLRLLLTFEKVTSVDKALRVLQPLDVKATVEAPQPPKGEIKWGK